VRLKLGFVQVLHALAAFDYERPLGFGVALCKFVRADYKRLLGFGMALCKFYNPLILNGFLALARLQIRAIY
jgi:hypothetical protein